MFIGLNPKGYAQNAIKDSTTKNHYLLEMDIIAPFLSSFTLGMEFSRGKNYSVRADLGYFQRNIESTYSDDNSKIGESKGYFGRLGYLYYFNKKGGKKLTNRGHHTGFYAGTDLLIQRMIIETSRVKYVHSIDSMYKIIDKEQELGFGMVILLGRQIQINNTLYLDGFFGIGLGYNYWQYEHNLGEKEVQPVPKEFVSPIGFGSRGLSPVFEGGLKLGVLIK
jgi:hypothetical protein